MRIKKNHNYKIYQREE